MAIDIRQFRKRTNMTQRDLAQKLGCTQPVVSVWEKNKYVPTYENICQLIDIGISAEELFGPERARKLMSHPPRDFDSKEFHDGVALVVQELKAMGRI